MSFQCIFFVYTTLTKAIKNDICVAFIRLSCQDCSTSLLITGVNIILCPLMPSFLIELYHKCVCIGKKNNTHRHLLGILGYVLWGCGKEGLVRVFLAYLSWVTWACACVYSIPLPGHLTFRNPVSQSWHT